MSKMTKTEEEALRTDASNYLVQRWEPRPGIKMPIVARGEGAQFWDITGTRYLDLIAQLFNVHAGMGVREIIEATKKQLDELAYSSPSYFSIPQVKLAKRLAEIMPGSLHNNAKTFFGNSGAEANEVAIKVSQMYRASTTQFQSSKIISYWDAYHGSTYATVGIGGAARNRLIPGLSIMEEFKHVPPPYCYRCVLKQTYPDCDLACAEFIRYTIEKEGAKSVAAFLAEPICSWAGQTVPPPDYWSRVRKICDETGVLLVLDEVMTGFCQTGKMFGCENWNVTPDIMTLAKGLTSGYIPLGAAVVNKKIAEYFDKKGFAHSYTYSGHATACASGIANIDYYVKNKLVEKAAKLGAYVLDELKGMQERSPIIGDIRSVGLFIGMELVANKRTKEPIMPKGLTPEQMSDANVNPVLWLQDRMEFDKHVVIGATPAQGVVRMMPTPAITKEQLGEGLRVLEETVGEMAKKFNLPKK